MLTGTYVHVIKLYMSRNFNASDFTGKKTASSKNKNIKKGV